MNLGRVLGRQKQPQVASPAADKPVETTKIEETFKEHYPLLVPYSYAAIVEDEKKARAVQ